MSSSRTGDTESPRLTDGAPARYATFTSRFRALLIDTALVIGAFVVILLLGEFSESIPGSGRIVWALMVGLVLLYEPLFVWRRGATIGHAAKHLKVVSTATGERPGLLQALARYLIKVILGLPSFVTMALSRKHQAVHDILSQTTVQLSASADPHVDGYHLERLEPSDVTLPSRGRRLGAILIYLVAVFVGYGMALTAIDPAGCAQTRSCTGGLGVATDGLALLWLGLSIAIVVVGWKGRLFGARRARHASPNPLSPNE